MAVVPYWKERLEERRPVRNLAYWREDYDWKHRVDAPLDTWPRMVAKQALWNDYVAWHEDVYLAPFRVSQYFIDFPDQLPKAATVEEFWHALAPLIYVSGSKEMQTRRYYVWVLRMIEGEPRQVKVFRAFVRLGTWDEHLAQFSLLTGGGDPLKSIDMVGGAMRRMRATNDANRNRLPKIMRKTYGD